MVGLGHIAQHSILPAFKNARNSQLVALVSGNATKLREVGRKYRIKDLYSYDQIDDCLSSGKIDAIYITLPNDQHRQYVERAARAGIHVLCEKPMAVSSKDCEKMIQSAKENHVKLMIAYRLHFEEANLKAINLVKSGKIGEPRIFQSLFTMAVKDHGIRLNPRELGGGPLYDIGVYCINAARYIFQSEPLEVTAFSGRSKGIEETISAVLRFSKDRIASFTCSFGSSPTDSYQISGTKGQLRVENAYSYEGEKLHELIIKGKSRTKTFKERDHFSPELIYFSNCILKNKQPEPSGVEGLADVRVIEAIYQSIDQKHPIAIHPVSKEKRADLSQELRRPKVEATELVEVEEPSKDEAA
jgi:glucose-fructose oxidoreductase